MTEFRERVTVSDPHNRDHTYTRMHFRCEKDDTWGRIELPQVTPQEERTGVKAI